MGDLGKGRERIRKGKVSCRIENNIVSGGECLKKSDL